MTARELFQSGQLDDAIAAAILEVKDQPGDLSRRTLLFVLLCFTGDFERARKQLTAIDAQATLSDAPTYLNLLAGEEKRRRVLNEGQAPKFLADSPARTEAGRVERRRVQPGAGPAGRTVWIVGGHCCWTRRSRINSRKQFLDRLRAEIDQREGAAGGAGEGDARGEEEEVFHDSAGAKGGRWEFTL